MVAGTLYLVRHLILKPHLAVAGDFALSSIPFALLAAATVLIAAGGYVVNDIRDQEMDAANKPDRLFIGHGLSEQAAWKLYAALNAAAFLSFAGLVGLAGFSAWMLVIPLAAGLLAAYAFRLKCSPLVGNLTVSLLSALIPLLVLAAEYQALIIPAGSRAMRLGSAYALFAFAASWFREGVKDLEDAEGDGQSGCGTLAVRAPYLARTMALVPLAGLTVGVLLFLSARQVGMLGWAAGISFVILPALASALLLFMARGPDDFRRISLVAKVLMIGGLALLPLVPS